MSQKSLHKYVNIPKFLKFHNATLYNVIDDLSIYSIFNPRIGGFNGLGPCFTKDGKILFYSNWIF